MSATHANCVPATGNDGWHQLTELNELAKWQYKDSPYRVVVTKDPSGHYRAIFTSWYNPTFYLIKGGCGGSELGRLEAVLAAEEFMEEHRYGCPPPGEL